MTIKSRKLILTSLLYISCNILMANCNTLSGGTVPVLLWSNSPEIDSHKTAINPLCKTSQDEFMQILNNKTDKIQPPIYIFVKDSLCVEDLTQHKEDLRQMTNRTLLAYLPAVESPLSVLENFSSYNQSYDENIDSISDGQLFIKQIISLDNISELYKNIKDTNPYLIAALTGRSCSYSRSERIRRANADDNTNTPRKTTDCNECDYNSTESGFIVKGEKVLLYWNKSPMIKLNDSDPFINLSAISLCKECVNQTSNKVQLDLTFSINNSDKIPLQFNIENFSSGYYSLRNIILKPFENYRREEVLTSITDMVFPFNFSYHCSNVITFSGENTTLKLNNIQLQIDANKFSDAYDCVNFTTIPIWTGIFVTVILGSIMIWGLAMIIDIRTMDRFDDPKGKTITISAQEN